jgi:hypothetical protein
MVSVLISLGFPSHKCSVGQLMHWTWLIILNQFPLCLGWRWFSSLTHFVGDFTLLDTFICGHLKQLRNFILFGSLRLINSRLRSFSQNWFRNKYLVPLEEGAVHVLGGWLIQDWRCRKWEPLLYLHSNHHSAWRAAIDISCAREVLIVNFNFIDPIIERLDWQKL